MPSETRGNAGVDFPPKHPAPAPTSACARANFYAACTDAAAALGRAVRAKRMTRGTRVVDGGDNGPDGRGPGAEICLALLLACGGDACAARAALRPALAYAGARDEAARAAAWDALRGAAEEGGRADEDAAPLPPPSPSTTLSPSRSPPRLLRRQGRLCGGGG